MTALYELLFCNVKNKIVSIAKTELSYACIGKKTADLKYQRITLLNMYRLFDECLTTTELNTLDCYYTAHFGAKVSSKKKVVSRSTSSSSTPGSVAALALITTDAQTVNNYLWCFSALNINFTGGQPNYVVRDVLDPTFMAIISDLNAKALQYSGGAITNIEQVIVGRTDWTLGGGYNCSDCAFGNGECCPTVTFTQDFFLVNVELCRQLGIGLDVDCNVQLPDVTWQAQIAWKITHMANQGVPLKNILIGQENVTSVCDIYWLGFAATNNTDYTNKAIAYITKVEPELNTLVAANPTKNFYLDSASIGETGNRDTLWNAQLPGKSNQGFRQYFNLTNLLANPTIYLSPTDWSANLAIINATVFTTAVSRLNAFKVKYPTQKMGIYQWGLRNPNDPVNLENKILGMLFQAKMTKMYLDYNFANNDLISYASYQDLKQFVKNDNTLQMFGKTLVLIGQLFEGTTVQYIPVTFSLGSGVTGVATFDGTTYRILAINDGGAAGSSDDGITINGTFKSSWTRESYYGYSLGSTDISHSTTTDTALALPAFSISILTLT